MKIQNSPAVKVNVSFLDLLTLVFVAAKLWGRVDWSWVWVLAPLWAPTALVLGLAVVALALLGAVAVVANVAGLITSARRVKRASRHRPRQ